LSRERWEGKRSRWDRIARESCKQCGLTRVPAIASVTSFQEALKRRLSGELTLFPTLAVPGKPLKTVLTAQKDAPASVAVWIGPEGDFTPEEASTAVAQGAIPVTLGKLVLRSETAALYLLSALKFWFPND
jgi:16S rRNA (uracil1498-N3)-methyltransferase